MVHPRGYSFPIRSWKPAGHQAFAAHLASMYHCLADCVVHVLSCLVHMLMLQSEILWYSSQHLASTLAVLPNLTVRCVASVCWTALQTVQVRTCADSRQTQGLGSVFLRKDPRKAHQAALRGRCYFWPP